MVAEKVEVDWELVGLSLPQDFVPTTVISIDETEIQIKIHNTKTNQTDVFRCMTSIFRKQ